MVFKSNKVEEASVEAPVELPVQARKTDLTNVALSIYKNISDGTWHVVKVQYNPNTGETGNFSSKSTGTNFRDEAEYQFKLAAVEDVFNA